MPVRIVPGAGGAGRNACPTKFLAVWETFLSATHAAETEAVEEPFAAGRPEEANKVNRLVNPKAEMAAVARSLGVSSGDS